MSNRDPPREIFDLIIALSKPTPQDLCNLALVYQALGPTAERLLYCRVIIDISVEDHGRQRPFGALETLLRNTTKAGVT
ncbi:hypothetical protein BKA70DRAFT_1441094 [Coprinopsis sp. MPI-PUGE-AT-0042]|nr:hypothetical protein BKA70DRAFT_1441094 [Coprinopsis sp. MPI-PUGE-AT-0042]